MTNSVTGYLWGATSEEILTLYAKRYPLFGDVPFLFCPIELSLPLNFGIMLLRTQPIVVAVRKFPAAALWWRANMRPINNA